MAEMAIFKPAATHEEGLTPQSTQRAQRPDDKGAAGGDGTLPGQPANSLRVLRGEKMNANKTRISSESSEAKAR